MTSRIAQKIFASLFLFLFMCIPQFANALDADDLSNLIGYTIVGSSNVRGDFEGADFDKPVALDNGMVFTFSTYSYTYSYRPTAIILARTFSVEELRRFRLNPPPNRPLTLYKLVIGDAIYDAHRVR